MTRYLVVLLSILVSLYSGVCFLLFALQRSMIFQPQRGNDPYPGDALKLAVPGAELRIVVRPRSGPKALLYFGGNAENVGLSLPSLSSAFPDHALFLMDYRGYGGSSGKPSEDALQGDALALYDRVHTEHAQIAVLGRSLGSGIAVWTASRRTVSALLLVTPYNSIEELAARRFPYVPIRWLLIDKFESWRHARTIRAPTLLLAAADDQTVPPSSAEKLYAAFPRGVATLKIIPYFGHNDISASPLYLEYLGAAVSSAEVRTAP